MKIETSMPFGNGTDISSLVERDSTIKKLSSDEAFNKKMLQFKRKIFGFIGSRYNSHIVVKDFEYIDSVLKSMNLSKNSTDSRLFLESVINQGTEFYDNSFRVKKCYIHAQKILDSTKELYKLEFSKPTNPLFFK
jgi:hypothetical protein